MTLQDRAEAQHSQYLATKGERKEYHRSAADFFYMAQRSVEQHDAKGATHRYRMGLHYAHLAESMD